MNVETKEPTTCLTPAKAAFERHKQRFTLIYGICASLAVVKLILLGSGGRFSTVEVGIIFVVHGGLVILVIGFDLLLRLNIKLKHK